jgi:hypothetical protein
MAHQPVFGSRRAPATTPNSTKGLATAREWDVAHAAALRALLTQPPAVLPNQVGDPLLPLQIGIKDTLLALLRPGAKPESLARTLRAYTRSMGTSWRVPERMRCATTWMGEWSSRSVTTTAREP